VSRLRDAAEAAEASGRAANNASVPAAYAAYAATACADFATAKTIVNVAYFAACDAESAAGVSERRWQLARILERIKTMV